MAVFSVSYDLNKKDKNYDGLYKELEKGAYAHIMDSTWLVYTTETVGQLYDRLRAQTDDNDWLFISQVTSVHQGWLLKSHVEWLTKHMAI